MQTALILTIILIAAFAAFANFEAAQRDKKNRFYDK